MNARRGGEVATWQKFLQNYLKGAAKNIIWMRKTLFCQMFKYFFHKPSKTYLLKVHVFFGVGRICFYIWHDQLGGSIFRNLKIRCVVVAKCQKTSTDHFLNFQNLIVLRKSFIIFLHPYQ